MALVPAVPRKTFHYLGCGCGSRPWCGDHVDWMWTEPRLASSTDGVARPLRVCYFLPHHNVTGGMKMLIKHMAHLKKRGHWVMAAFRGPAGSPVLPPWAVSLVKVDEARLIAPHESIASVLPVVDLVMIGYFTQLLEFRDIQVAPGAIVYWDQGHEHVFGDPTANPEWDRVFHVSMHLPVALLSVSNIVRDILAHHFARAAPVIPNAIDTSLFYPGPPPAPHPHRISGAFPVDPHGPRRVLLVGNPGLLLKNFDTAFAVLTKVQGWLLEDATRQGFSNQIEAATAAAGKLAALTAKESGDKALAGPSSSSSATTESRQSRGDIRIASPLGLHVTWMCQARPAGLPAQVRVDLIVNPPQEAIPDIYRSGFDCILFCSAYEAWGMPVIEAMASGVPVVTSLCHGVDMFASHRYNCLAAKPFDVQALSRCLFAMLTRPSLQSTFARRALEVSRKFSWDAAMLSLEKALYQVDRCVGRGEAAGGRVAAPASALAAVRAAQSGVSHHALLPSSAPSALYTPVHNHGIPAATAKTASSAAAGSLSGTGGPGAGDSSLARAVAVAASKILNGSESALPSTSGSASRSGTRHRDKADTRARQTSAAASSTHFESGSHSGPAAAAAASGGGSGDGTHGSVRAAGDGPEPAELSVPKLHQPSSSSSGGGGGTAAGASGLSSSSSSSSSRINGFGASGVSRRHGVGSSAASVRSVASSSAAAVRALREEEASAERARDDGVSHSHSQSHHLDPGLELALTRVKALMETPDGKATLASLAAAATPLSTEPALPAELFRDGMAKTAGSVPGGTGGPPAASSSTRIEPAAAAVLSRIIQTPTPPALPVTAFQSAGAGASVGAGAPLTSHYAHHAAAAAAAYVAAGGVAGGAGLVMPHAHAAALVAGAGVAWAQPQHMPMTHVHLAHHLHTQQQQHQQQHLVHPQAPHQFLQPHHPGHSAVYSHQPVQGHVPHPAAIAAPAVAMLGHSGAPPHVTGPSGVVHPGMAFSALPMHSHAALPMHSHAALPMHSHAAVPMHSHAALPMHSHAALPMSAHGHSSLSAAAAGSGSGMMMQPHGAAHTAAGPGLYPLAGRATASHLSPMAMHPPAPGFGMQAHGYA